jgi:predicted DNA-binding protein (MmcQ/YjbR family)
MAELTAAMKAILDALPGATSEPTPGPPGRAGRSLMYKVTGKVFAFLNVRGPETVSVKCDPHLGEILREQYEGAGHYRLHLRNWISLRLDADIPFAEAERLAAGSYELVRSGLTRRQQAELLAVHVRFPPDASGPDG